jgi:hypothetical protein
MVPLLYALMYVFESKHGHTVWLMYVCMYVGTGYIRAKGEIKEQVRLLYYHAYIHTHIYIHTYMHAFIKYSYFTIASCAAQTCTCASL